jgi:hypothetical protein
MTHEDILQELNRQPYVPLRLHLASGQKIDLPYENSAFVRQNTLLVLERLAPRSAAIGVYDVIALRLIERIEQLDKVAKRKRRRRGDAA